MTVEEQQIKLADSHAPRALHHMSDEESKAKGKAARTAVPR